MAEAVGVLSSFARQGSKLQFLHSAYLQMRLEVKEASFSVIRFKHSFSGRSFKVKAKCIMTSSFFNNWNVLDTFKKTYLTENSSTETEAEYQWMQGAYKHITGSNAKTQCRAFYCRTTLHVLSNLKITIVPRI